MSGSVAMPHPWIARSLTHRPGWEGRYLPMTQDTESPRNVTRGSLPGLRPGRSIGATDPVSDVDGCGVMLVTMTGAATAGGVGGGAVTSTIATAVAPTALIVAPTGACRGSSRVSAPCRIVDSTR